MSSPKLARSILAALLPQQIRDAAIGDLEEGFATAPSPRLWYWRQVAASILPAIRIRWRSPGILRVGAAAIVGYVVLAAIAGVILPLLDWFFESHTPAFWTIQIVGDVIAGLTAGVVIATLVPMSPLRAARIFAVVLALLTVLTTWLEFGKVPLLYHAFLILAGPGCVMLGASISGGGKRSRTS